jgi:hypothetical protein
LGLPVRALEGRRVCERPHSLDRRSGRTAVARNARMIARRRGSDRCGWKPCMQRTNSATGGSSIASCAITRRRRQDRRAFGPLIAQPGNHPCIECKGGGRFSPGGPGVAGSGPGRDWVVAAGRLGRARPDASRPEPVHARTAQAFAERLFVWISWWTKSWTSPLPARRPRAYDRRPTGRRPPAMDDRGSSQAADGRP